MSDRQTHHGARPERTGSDTGATGLPLAGTEVTSVADDAKKISSAIDKNEGFDRRDHREPHRGASHGRKTRNAK